MHYSGTKCHACFYTLYNPDNLRDTKDRCAQRHAARTMSYLAPASFHFVRGIIKVSKGSDIANLASLEVLVSVRLQVKFST